MMSNHDLSAGHRGIQHQLGIHELRVDELAYAIRGGCGVSRGNY